MSGGPHASPSSGGFPPSPRLTGPSHHRVRVHVSASFQARASRVLLCMPHCESHFLSPGPCELGSELRSQLWKAHPIPSFWNVGAAWSKPLCLHTFSQ